MAEDEMVSVTLTNTKQSILGVDDQIPDSNEETPELEPTKKGSVGWYSVLIICLLHLFGVIIFLRVPFITGQAGVSHTILIIFISAFICLLNTLSMSIICKSGTISSGGPYYFLSRILGPTIGGCIGILYSAARIATCALYLIGFTETFVDIIGPILTGDATGDVRIWSVIVLIMISLLFIVIRLKQSMYILLLLLMLIVLSLLLVFIGSFYREYYDDNDIVITPKGWSNGNLKENMKSSYQYDIDFGTMFLMFFPVYASLTTGADISGDLQNPSDDIPKGTLISILISIPIYGLMVIFSGAVVLRDELFTNPLVLTAICVSQPFIWIGILSTTMASAVIALITAPRIIESMMNDNIFLCCSLCTKYNYKIAYLLTFFGALILCLVTELNDIAPLVAQIFLLTNLLMNSACIMLYKNKNSEYKYINPLVCILIGVSGGIASIIVMFAMGWLSCVIVIAVMLIICVCIYFGRTKTLDWTQKVMQYNKQQ